MRHRIHQQDTCNSFLIDLSPYKYHMCFDSLACTVNICHLCTVCNSMWSNQLEQMRRNIRQRDMHSLYLNVPSLCKYRMCFDSLVCTIGIYHLYMVCNSMWWNRQEQKRRNNHQPDMHSLYLIVLSPYKYRMCFDSLACTVDIYRLYRVCNSRLSNPPKQKRHRIHQPDRCS